MDKALQQIAVKAAKKAGEQILTFYKTDVGNEWKLDGSPLTVADHGSHSIISQYLEETGIPVVSEEGSDFHMDADRYWIVDPLDGTKEFLAANDEFTINIALIEHRKPVFGVVYAPALKEMYIGNRECGTRMEKHGIETEYSQQSRRNSLIMAVSRFHNHKLSAIFAMNNNITSQMQVGSALKFGRLVSGDIDVYPRFEGCSEWDTAAGQAVLEAAGGKIIDLHTGEPLTYGKASRRNSSFLAFRAPYSFTDFIINQS